MRVYLIGFMGSGKTTVGRKLAKKLHFNFIDTDQMIEEQTGLSVSKIFSQEGEDYFRELERHVLTQTFECNNYVISTGGGMPCFYDNMQRLLANGLVIYIKMSSLALFNRIVQSHKDRPLFANLTREQTKAKIEALLLEREKFYEQAHKKIDGLNLNVNTIVI